MKDGGMAMAVKNTNAQYFELLKQKSVNDGVIKDKTLQRFRSLKKKVATRTKSFTLKIMTSSMKQPCLGFAVKMTREKVF